MKKPKILVILGPTASGKSDLAVKLAGQFNGEIISADSRQVYKGLDIGSGKITKKEMKGIKHHLLDMVCPQTIFTVVKFQRLAKQKIEEILAREKLPIICGGTGFYIQSIIDGIIFPKIKPNPTLRTYLEVQPPSELFSLLKKLDPKKAQTIDPKNPHRLIRAIEIAQSFSLSAPSANDLSLSAWSAKSNKWEVLQIGVRVEREILKKRIEKRFLMRVKWGIVAEAKKLHKRGLTYKRFSEIGLAHKYLSFYLQNKISKGEFIKKSIQAEQKYAKRQMTWFKRDKKIKWFELSEVERVKDTVSIFLKK